MNRHVRDAGGDRVAIVGIGCRLPGGAGDHRAFWRNLVAGNSCIIDTPASRYDVAALGSRDPTGPGRLVGGRGGYIDGLDEFDPAFFGISPREAESMDPQQRKLLEVAWEALEDAGQRPAELAGQSVGVFIGASTLDYQILQFADPSFEQLAEHTATGTMMAMVANRISYCFDFRGPSMAIDTACSSSLVAVHLACRSLVIGESCLALAGGVALHMAPHHAIAQTRGGLLSPDGRSRPFDAGANGRVRAEGAGVVVLKRLAEALRDGDPIHAVIAGSGINQGGRSDGITVPSGDAQVALIRQVCQDAGVSPGALQYVEAHGASTPLGDSIEARALGTVLADGREPGSRCYVGSVKANLGHAESAAGVAGLIKVALSLKHKQIPPHIHLEQIHPTIDPAGLAIEIPTRLTGWPPHVGPARAGVNALGLGGTNAHVVLEEPPADRRPAAQARPGYNLLPLTARDPSVFPDMVAALARELAGDPGPAPAVSDVGYTLARRRQHLEARLSFVYSSPADLAELLARYLTGEASPRIVAGSRLDDRRRRLAWVFTGIGPAWWAMGRELFANEPVYREVIERCDHEIARLAGWSLIDELAADEAASNMSEPCLAQPASFALQIGLAALWRSLGVRPDAIVGHGTGELAAFYEAGVYRLEDAVQIAIRCSRLHHELVGAGAMLEVGLSEAAAEARIAPVADRVAIAAIDGPTAVTLSGDRGALEELRAQLDAEQVLARFLPVAIPYHSPAMDRIRDELVMSLADLHPRPAALPLYLTAAEGTAGGPELDAVYWWRNVREPVRFHAAIGRMIDAGCGVFLELGPHPVLGSAIAQCLQARGAEGRALPSIRRQEDEPCQVMASLAALHGAGLDLAWDQLYPAGRTVPLPAYPWKRDRYWIDERREAAGGEAPRGIDGWLLDVSWVELAALPEDGAAAAGDPGDPWIVLADAHGLGAELARQIDARGARAWLVRPGSRFTLDREQRAATIDPGSAADAGALLAAIADRSERRRCRVVHLWSLDAPALAEASAAQLRDAAAHATYSLVVMARALLASEIAGELSIVTRGAQAVLPGAAVEPAGAPAWGVGRVLRDHELAGCRGKLIDLELGGERSAEAAVLARELVTAGEDELALRGGRRFTPRLAPAAGLTRTLPVRLRPDGTYLVTGAFGALGRLVCRLLVQRGARRLIAMGRSKLPPRIAWHALDPAGPAASCVRFVQELEALGAEVMAAPVDVTDEPALTGWLAGFRALAYPPIRGVFHAAGQVRAARVSELDRATFDAVHDPKVIGAYLLHRHTAGEPLDHFAMFSSIGSLLTTAGQTHCAAGNAFLDALAHHRRSAGLPALGVNWGPWASSRPGRIDERSEAAGGGGPAGLAGGAGGEAPRGIDELGPIDRDRDRRGMSCLAPDAAIEVLDRVLGQDRAQVVVAAVADWRAFLARYPVVPRLVAGIAEAAGVQAAGGTAGVEIYTDETWFPLTQNQRALWLRSQLDRDGFAYHVGSAVGIRARLDPELMFAAVRILIRRHAMLRARFALRDGRPVQRIAPDITADVQLIDVRGWAWADIHDAVLREYRKPFDLERDPLFRFRLFQRDDRRFILMQAAHHIISDAVSMRMFTGELLAVYDALRRGVDPVLPPVRARYLDFLNWQNRLLASPDADRLLRYWTEHLPAEVPALQLPTDRPRPAVQARHGASQCFVLDRDLTAAIHALSEDTGATPFMILLAAYSLLLHRYSGQDDLIIGSPATGRTHDELAATYGCFVNPLPLHVTLAGDPSFGELLDRVRATVLGGLDHQDYPFARLVQQLGVPHDAGRSEVFQAMFVLAVDRVATEQHGFQLDHIELREVAGQLDLTLSVREDEAERAFRCVLSYSSDLFDAETIRRMASHYTVLLTSLTADPRRPISGLEMLAAAERVRIVQRWSGADLAVVPDLPVHVMISRHAAQRPDALAVVAPADGGVRILTYGELDAAARRLARRLCQLGVSDGDIVAVCLDRSPELVVSLLAILQAGAAYLPVDPEDPDDRIAYRIEDAGARFLVGDAIAGRLAGLPGCTRVSIADPIGGRAPAAARDPAPVVVSARLDRTACVIYTSGSTGRPRGVRIAHHSLASAYHAWDVIYRLRSEARVHLQTASAALDGFTGDLVRALCSGGALCLAGKPLVLDAARLYETMVRHAVDTAELAPAIARRLAAYCRRDGKRLDFLRLAVVGSGAWTVEDHRQLRALLGRRSRLITSYDLTEATIGTYFEGLVDGMEPGQIVPIGVPFPGSRVFVLDRHGAPVPAGVPGELWVGGNGVAAGYVGEPDPTAARFKTVELDERGPMRLYRTGDVARWDARGTLHLCERADGNG